MDPTRSEHAAANDALPIHHSYPQVAHRLIETLNGVLHPTGKAANQSNASGTDLEVILDMIQANLTYDDPGIFIGCATSDPLARRLQLDFNVWLHHQIVFIVACYPSPALRLKAAELQHEMLAASLLKQRWLFGAMVARYAELLRDLCDLTRLPYTVWQLQPPPEGTIADDDGDNRADTANYSIIEVATLSLRDTLAINCIQLLKHSVALCANSDERLTQLAADSVLEAFVVLGLAGKTHAIEFFVKVMRRKIVEPLTDHTQSLLHRVVPKLMQGIQQIRSQVAVWLRYDCGVRPNDVRRFVSTVGYWLAIGELPGYCSTPYNYRMCVEMCTFLLLHTTGMAATSGADGQTAVVVADEASAFFDAKFEMSVLRLFGKVLRLNSVDFRRDLDAMFVMERRDRMQPDVVSLLQCCVRDRLQGQPPSDGEDTLLDLVDELVEWAFDGKVETATKFKEKCRLINTLTTMLLAAEHEFQLHHQQTHLNHTTADLHLTCATCLSPEMLDEWDRLNFLHFNHQLRQTHRRLHRTLTTLAARFLRLCNEHSERCVLSTDGVFELSDVAWRLFGSAHTRSLGEPLQLHLFALAMATLQAPQSPHRRRLTTGHPHIAVIVQKIVPNAELTQFHAHLLHTIMSAQLHRGLSAALRTDLVQQVVDIPDDRLDACEKSALWQKLLLHAVLPIPELLAATIDRLDRLQPESGALMAQLLPVVVCRAGGRAYAVTTDRRPYTKLCCMECDACNKEDATNDPVQSLCLIQTQRSGIGIAQPALLHSLLGTWLPILCKAPDALTRSDLVAVLPALSRHCCGELVQAADTWLTLCGDNAPGVRSALVAALPAVLANVQTNDSLTARQRRQFFEALFRHLSKAVEQSMSGDSESQSAVVQLLRAVATHPHCTEITVLQGVLLALVYLVRAESQAAKTAALAAVEMCSRFGTTVRKMVAWHRERIFQLLVDAAVANYLQYGLPLQTTLSNFCHLLGYQHMHSSFMPHYAATLLALLLPWRMRMPSVEPLLEELCTAQNKTREHVWARAFLHVYPHVCLRQTTEVRDRCVEYFLAGSGMELVQLLKMDSRRTLNEILVWYHRNPEFVMHTLRQLLGPAPETTTATCTQQPLAVIVEYIAQRFLGVINYFDVVLVATDMEKSLQAETLLSLGDIIRFMGAVHITPFRFKILTVLRSVLAIDARRRLRDICASVWKIFVYTVDVQSMGPMLSIVVVFLEPLMVTHAAVVNDILRYLIISNGSLLSMHINDLFFIERTRASAEIKEFVARHARDAVGFESRLRLFAKQAAHENIDVRVYALRYLSDLFDRERRSLNALVIGQQRVHPLVLELLGSLLEGSRHADAQLQLAAGRCLGRIGALEPGHLPPNYAPQTRFALGAHTDLFAVMALAELCRAYQFQKDSKRVDGFSLAIQEILLARGVCPHSGKKMNVWTAIPERMRQLMMPLLKSCYTALPAGAAPTAHPVFGPGRFATAEAWACAWATRLTEFVEDENTKHLLQSFRTSLRNDSGVLQAFMPYIVLHAVQTCSEANGALVEDELQCLFRVVLAGSGRPDGDELAYKCAKIAFNQLEFLRHWLRQYRIVYANTTDDAYRRVDALLAAFDPKQVAAANFRCGEFARALQYLEVYVEQNRDERLQPELSFLAQCYSELVDSDSLQGALHMKAAKPTLSEQVMLHNATGRLQEATVCFEQMMQLGDMSETGAVDMIQCYLGLDQPETALMVSDALMRQMYDRHAVPSSMYACSAEPLWRLGRFEELDALLTTARLRDAPDWGIRCGQVLVAMRHGGEEEFGEQMVRCHASVLRELRTHDGNEHGSYDKVYPLLLRLHQMAEIEMCQAAVVEVRQTDGAAVQTLRRLFGEWDARLELLQPTAKILEPVLCLRRCLLSETKSLIHRHISTERPSVAANCTAIIDTYIGASLIKSTELARSAEMYQQSQLFILNAETYSPPALFIEKARLCWSRGDQAASLSTLERGIEELRPALTDDKADAIGRLYAEAKFLVATYNADSMNTNTTLNIKYFKEALQATENSEKCYVFYAQYLEKVHAAVPSHEQNGSRGNDAQQEIMTCYGKSMSYGCRYIYQSMPRFLSIWLDFTARTAPPDPGESWRRVAQNMTKIADHFAGVLPSFVFFTAFSQLVSRICHPSAEVYAALKTILIKLINTFPQQSIWMLMCVYKSSYASRVKRCTEIFGDARLGAAASGGKSDVKKLIGDVNLLAERMIELTNRPVNSGDRPTIATFCKELPALLRSPGFSQIVLPINQYMQPVLPAADQRDRPASAFNAFPNAAVYIAGCQNELVVMPSMQKPKRITLIGSDGRDYMVMMKPKDDLRKDFRLMEFNAIVNQYLRQDAEARQRRLNIRTYAVLPLNEECGLIEWLPNLQALRPIVSQLLKRSALGMAARELRDVYAAARDPAAKRRMLTTVLIPRHPPQLAEWYKERFSTAHNWYLARSSYVRTTAVISMVGYVLGLGDRHGENILFDTANGDSVHVDFNCLFNKGECFEVPELVPFRLTHNMVHAMGPLGVEGAYRQCSQITLRVLREQQATLMSVVRPFVYDPLVSWNRTMSKTDGRQERTDTQAITNVKRIEERLQGFVKQNGVIGSMALSCEGVVKHCIDEATDVNNLAAMYVGWGPFI